MKNNKGFTLVETMVAMVILAAGLLLLTNSWGTAFTRVKKTQSAFEVAALLERKMAEVDMEYRGKSIDDIPESKEDDFGKDYPQYKWKLESKKLEMPDLGPMLTARDGGSSETMLGFIKQLSEGFSKSIKEVTVTVIFTPEKGKPAEYSVTTYFVDYDKELTFGVPGS